MRKEKEFDHNDEGHISDLLVGNSVINVSDNTLTLSNGVQVEIIPNEGCGGCASGNYTVQEIHEFDNVITSVQFDVECLEHEHSTYSVFVLAAGVRGRSLLFSVDGADGNGYYGTGYRLKVRIPGDRLT